jgi:hypothetical protein
MTPRASDGQANTLHVGAGGVIYGQQVPNGVVCGSTGSSTVRCELVTQLKVTTGLAPPSLL